MERTTSSTIGPSGLLSIQYDQPHGSHIPVEQSHNVLHVSAPAYAFTIRLCK